MWLNLYNTFLALELLAVPYVCHLAIPHCQLYPTQKMFATVTLFFFGFASLIAHYIKGGGGIHNDVIALQKS